jgi:hypothetical protein
VELLLDPARHDHVGQVDDVVAVDVGEQQGREGVRGDAGLHEA